MSTRYFHALYVSAALGAGLLLSGCGGSSTQSYPQIEGKGRIAVVSYSLNRSIVQKGDDPGTGPGILQNKEKYYIPYQAAVDTMWRQFIDQIGPSFDNAEFVSIDEIRGNQQYQELTRHKPKVVMGKDIAPGASYLTPEGINYVSLLDQEKTNAINESIGADLLMLVENDASYKMHAGVSIGGLGGGAGVMELQTTLYLWEPGNGVIWKKTYKTVSDEKAPIVQGAMGAKHFARLLASANQTLFSAVKADVLKGKEEAAAAQESSRE